ncbi:KAP family P-loop NTPase fold protein [Paracoccus sanguinis]|uniref:KAP family P-loop NTPase fold protein n=1 Tax=Paracoccus sanguinis TaxID=1545044 RepID=UPI0009DE3BE6|nr:P-loop NTPase fold protein [Paracoccus sanguinis]
MRFLPPDEHVNLYNSGFDDDLLGRAKVSKALSDVLERIEDPLVVALDGRWGTGKSYFLKRWVGAHTLQNGGEALTVYFDAFAHDYLSDPLIALVGALSERIPRTEGPKLDRVKNIAIKLIKPATRVGLALTTYGATEALSGIGDAAATAMKGEAEKAVDNFWRNEEGRQSGMAEFRAAIKTLTAPAGQKNATPLIIVIDELDRCRPDYALEVLEVIKHFFAVPHVHFVLGVNLKALENSVKVRYGAEIDATSYLQKFLSFTLNLPDDIGDHERTPSVIQYVSHLGAAMATPKNLLAEVRRQLEVLSKCNHISIRDVGKIMSTVSLLPEEAQGERIYAGWRTATVTLIITRVIRPDLFAKLLKASIGDEELATYIGATKECISQKLADGERNPNYNHKVLILYSIWMFICHDGILDDNEEWPAVAKFFDDFGRPDNVNKIPLKIYEDWLSVFKLS